jgi:hypothetical protein
MYLMFALFSLVAILVAIKRLVSSRKTPPVASAAPDEERQPAQRPTRTANASMEILEKAFPEPEAVPPRRDWDADSKETRTQVLKEGPRYLRTPNRVLDQLDMDIIVELKRLELARVKADVAEFQRRETEATVRHRQQLAAIRRSGKALSADPNPVEAGATWDDAHGGAGQDASMPPEFQQILDHPHLHEAQHRPIRGDRRDGGPSRH